MLDAIAESGYTDPIQGKVEPPMQFPFFDFRPSRELTLGVAIGVALGVLLRTILLHG